MQCKCSPLLALWHDISRQDQLKFEHLALSTVEIFLGFDFQDVIWTILLKLSREDAAQTC